MLFYTCSAFRDAEGEGTRYRLRRYLAAEKGREARDLRSHMRSLAGGDDGVPCQLLK